MCSGKIRFPILAAPIAVHGVYGSCCTYSPMLYMWISSLCRDQCLYNKKPVFSYAPICPLFNRYLSKDEVAQASRSKAQQDGGSVRLVTKDQFFSKRKSVSSLTSPSVQRYAGREGGKKRCPALFVFLKVFWVFPWRLFVLSRCVFL